MEGIGDFFFKKKGLVFPLKLRSTAGLSLISRLHKAHGTLSAIVGSFFVFCFKNILATLLVGTAILCSRTFRSFSTKAGKQKMLTTKKKMKKIYQGTLSPNPIALPAKPQILIYPALAAVVLKGQVVLQKTEAPS